MPSAACTARRGPSSCAIGAPKRAITPSPVYWLIVPSNRCTSVVISSKQRSMIRCTSSGSSRSASVVNPATSAKSTVTWRRSPSSADRDLRILSARCFGVYDGSGLRYATGDAGPGAAVSGGGPVGGGGGGGAPGRGAPPPAERAPGGAEVAQPG